VELYWRRVANLVLRAGRSLPERSRRVHRRGW